MYSYITTACSGRGCFVKKEKALVVHEQINNYYISSEIAPELQNEMDNIRLSNEDLAAEVSDDELIEMMDMIIQKVLSA